MSTEFETRREFSHQSLRRYWPKRFTKRQPFNPNSENQTYLEYLQIEQYLGEGVSDEEDEEEEGNEVEAEEEDGASCEDDGSSNAPEDDVNEQSKAADASNQISDVRRFMRGMERDEDFLDDYDMVDEVAKFCEGGSDGPFRAREKHVAILDERNIAGTIIDKGGYCRTNLEPLTLEQLFDKLSRKRLRVESDSTNAFDDEEIDAERRIVFISDLDSFTIQAIIKTASRTQAPALRDLFHKYLTRKTSIGVTISNGFPVFTLELHMPYYVLGKSKTASRDARRKSDGSPLRQSRKLDFLSRSLDASKGSNPTDQHYWLHEAQISIVVTGVNNWVWTAYGFVDTYFGSKGTVEDYDKLKGRHWEREDPLAAGRLNGGEPIWTPREYFLRVAQSRIREVLKEWNRIVRTVTEEVEGSRDLVYSSSKITAQKLEFLERRNSQMAALSTQLIGGLSETIQAWEGFRTTEANYFLFDEVSTAEPSLEASLNAIDKEFSKLMPGLRKLEQLKKELCDRREGLNAYLSLDGRAAARQLQDLTVLAIVFSPLLITSALFSATGVLPSPGLGKFIYVLVVVTGTMVAMLLVLYHWRYCLQRGVDYMQSAVSSFNELLNGNRISSDAESWDIEKGP
ncbi:hypothetical protein V499_05679 [Pseudogymnoascus sp. VKM F-103]|nr:hypothetical protein V499_05679 [Pseudogymnoascus sp. VKM F-103]